MSGPNYALEPPKEGREIPAPAIAYRPREPKAYRPGIGLIGCGGIAATHLAAYRDAGYHVRIVCDRHEKRARSKQAAYFPNADVATDYRAVLARDDIEVVDLTPHPEDRLPIIEAALIAGIHVLSQKPFVVDLQDGRRLVRLAKERGVRMAVNQNGRFAPHLAYMREVVRVGLIGSPVAIRIGMQWDHNWIKDLPFDRIHHILLYDFAIHWFDFVASVVCAPGAGFAPESWVFASIRRSPTQKATPPLLGQVVLDYGAGQASLTFDADAGYDPADTTVIVGSAGTIRSRGPSLSDQRVTVHTEQGWFAPPLEGSWFPGGFHGAMAELLSAIEAGRKPLHNAADNLTSLALCFAAVRSANTGKPVRLSEVERLETPQAQ